MVDVGNLSSGTIVTRRIKGLGGPSFIKIGNVKEIELAQIRQDKVSGRVPDRLVDCGSVQIIRQPQIIAIFGDDSRRKQVTYFRLYVNCQDLKCSRVVHMCCLYSSTLAGLQTHRCCLSLDITHRQDAPRVESALHGSSASKQTGFQRQDKGLLNPGGFFYSFTPTKLQ